MEADGGEAMGDPHPPTSLEVLSTGISVDTAPHFGGAVDVHVNGHRLWSAALPPGTQRVALPWPDAVAPFLDGTADVELRHPGTGRVLAFGSARLGESNAPISVLDGRGRRLTINKWGNLGIPLEGADSGLSERMLGRAEQLVVLLRAHGWIPFAVGGTLLGAARSGALLPHDDDIDLGVLLPPESHPADIVLQMFRLQRLLEAEGHTIVRHSMSHLQVTYLFDDGVADHYIDIFPAFYRDGKFFEPLAMEGPAGAVTIEPLSAIAIEGHELPAPADVEAWLAACYGPGWRVPDPSFRFEVPLRTRRRFWNWFGTYDLHRLYWSSPGRLRAEEPVDTDALVELFAEGAVVVDLGSGGGAASRRFAAAGHRTVAVDFALPAVQLAERLHGVRARRVNLNDTSDVLDLAVELLRSGHGASFYAGHTYDGLSGDGKENVLLLLKHAMGDGDLAVFDVDTELPPDFRFDDPTTWHVDLEDFARAAGRHGLVVEIIGGGRRDTPHGSRAWSRCRVRTRRGRESG